MSTLRGKHEGSKFGSNNSKYIVMASSSSTDPWSTQLTNILEGNAGYVRKTDEIPCRYSIFDILGIITCTGLNNLSIVYSRAQKCSRHNFDKVKFPGQGQRLTPVCTAEQAQQMIARLGGKSAGEFRATGEITNRKRKREAKKDDLYVMKYSTDDTAVKIGRSDNVENRRRRLEACQNFFVEVVVIFPGKGSLEDAVHHQLQNYQSKKGAGKEWFNISAADAALVCSNALKEIERER